MSVNILSIDGGGMKGIVSAIVLVQLEKYLKQYSGNENSGITDYFDIVAGTSTGSILTALLLCPDELGKPKYHAEDVLEMYITKGKMMFQKRPGYPVNSLFGLLKSKYTNRYFKRELKEYFGDMPLSRLLKPCLIVSYDMATRKTLFFNSNSCRVDPKRDILVRDAVLCSCSAPTYFPPVGTNRGMYFEHCLIDGGVAANNPAMSALVEALKFNHVTNLSDTYLLSLGNATTLKTYSCERTENWGIAKFAFPLINIIMESSEEIVDYQVRKLYECYNISNHYLRVEEMVHGEIPSMDDTSKEAINILIKIGNMLVEKQGVAIRAFAKRIVAIKN